MRTTATNRKIRVLLSDIRDGKLVPNLDLQRRLVWTNKDKRNFLKTVLEEYPFPEIYVAAGDVDLETGEGKEMLVDGQQRLTTLYQYFHGVADLELGNDLPAYAELTGPQKERFLEYDVAVRDLGKVDIKEIKEVFQRINSTSYSLNAMEIADARFNGELKQFAEEIAASSFFDQHHIFSATEIRRMKDLRFCLTYIITIMSTYFHRNTELESYLRHYNDELESQDDLRKEIRRVFDFVEACKFEPSSRVWGKADLFTLLVEIHRAMVREKKPLVPEVTSGKLKGFYDNVESYRPSGSGGSEIADYFEATQGAANDRRNRITRGKVIASVIKQSATALV